MPLKNAGYQTAFQGPCPQSTERCFFKFTRDLSRAYLFIPADSPVINQHKKNPMIQMFEVDTLWLKELNKGIEVNPRDLDGFG